MEYTYHVSSELEFFLFTMLDDRPSTAPVPHDVAGYFDFCPRDLASDVRQDIILGLEGIKHKLTPPPPVEENVYDFSDEKLRNLSIDTLPGSLIEALGELERDEVLRGSLGEHVYEAFMRAKDTEWNQYRTQVTKWELDQYLNFP